MLKKRIVITGLGSLTPIGQNVEEFWNNSLKGLSNIERIPNQWLSFSNFNSQIWSTLPDINFDETQVSRIEQKQLDLTSLISIKTTFEALNSAGLDYFQNNQKANTYKINGVDPNRSGVFLGTGVGGITTYTSCMSHQILSKQKNRLESLKNKLENKKADALDIIEVKEIIDKMYMPKRYHPYVVSMIMPNAISSNLAIKFHINGPNLTYNAACASGTIAIGHGFKAIQNGSLDIAISGGVEYLYDDFGGIFHGFDIVRTLSNNNENPDEANRPFDRDRTGFLFSQGGSATLILEELEHALKRNAPIIAEVIGYSETCDANNIMAIENSGINISRMLDIAIEDAGIKKNQIDYINAHGTGTVINDEIESRIIYDYFKDKVLVNSTKSLIGHALGSSGAIEAVITALSIKNKTSHICKNLVNPIRELNFITSVEEYPIRIGLSQSFGFGGHNACLILKEYN